MCVREVYVRLDPVVCASRECSSVWSSRSVFCPFLFFFFLLSFGQNTSRYSAAMRYGGRTTRRALSALLSPPFLTCALSMPWCAYVCLRRVLFLSFSILLSMLQSNAQRCDPRSRRALSALLIPPLLSGVLCISIHTRIFACRDIESLLLSPSSNAPLHPSLLISPSCQATTSSHHHRDVNRQGEGTPLSFHHHST